MPVTGRLAGWVCAARPAPGRYRPGGDAVPHYTLDELWTAQQCADFAGVRLRTWHAYVNRPTRSNPAPQPVTRAGVTPLWLPADVIAWHRARPGSPIRPS